MELPYPPNSINVAQGSRACIALWLWTLMQRVAISGFSAA
jgi:hypothetical protein